MALAIAQVNAPMGERWKASIRSALTLAPHAATSMLRSTWTRSIDAFAFVLSARVPYVEEQNQDDGARYRTASVPAEYALEEDQEPPAGAHMLTRRWGYTHHGIYVGRGRVVQYGGLSLGLRRGPVEEVTLSQFALGRAIRIRSSESASINRDEVVRRARSRLGENRYHVLTNNCEHFCEWCVRGEARSYQVERLVARAAFLRHIVGLVQPRLL